MKKQRIYIDTSVIGGYYDEEFSKWSKGLFKDLKNNIDHHDGTQAVDMDGDGDLDIISIGWYNPKIWVFENL